MVKYILILLLFSGCALTKDLKRDNTETITEQVNKGELTIKRASDTLEITIPTIKYKDTTIYKRGRKSTIYLNYDNKGKASVISVCDSIAIFKKWHKEINVNEQKDVKEKVKETVFNDELILYIFIGLAFLIIISKLANKFI